MKKVLTIAGSDSSGGAGIQADLKTMMAHGVYGMSVITALTAQNTCGVKAVLPVEPDFLACQLDAVFQDIMPDAVKIGMVPSAGAVKVIAEALKKYKARNVVLDPVMLSTSGTTLAGTGAVEAMKTLLFPRCDLITPNIPELANLDYGWRCQGGEEWEKQWQSHLHPGGDGACGQGGRQPLWCGNSL